MERHTLIFDNKDTGEVGQIRYSFSDLQIVVKLSNEVPRNILGSQKVWVIFHENETFLGHFSKKLDILGSFFTKLRLFFVIFHEIDTFFGHFSRN